MRLQSVIGRRPRDLETSLVQIRGHYALLAQNFVTRPDPRSVEARLDKVVKCSEFICGVPYHWTVSPNLTSDRSKNGSERPMAHQSYYALPLKKSNIFGLFVLNY